MIVTGRNLDMRVHADIMQGRDVTLGDMVVRGVAYAA
jgi:threonine dehydratase